jgi:hypothetical protein
MSPTPRVVNVSTLPPRLVPEVLKHHDRSPDPLPGWSNSVARSRTQDEQIRPRPALIRTTSVAHSIGVLRQKRHVKAAHLRARYAFASAFV